MAAIGRLFELEYTATSPYSKLRLQVCALVDVMLLLFTYLSESAASEHLDASNFLRLLIAPNTSGNSDRLSLPCRFSSSREEHDFKL